MNNKNIEGRIFNLHSFDKSTIVISLDVFKKNQSIENEIDCWKSVEGRKFYIKKNITIEHVFRLVETVDLTMSCVRIETAEQSDNIVKNLVILDDNTLETQNPLCELFVKTQFSTFHSTINLEYLMKQMSSYGYKYIGVCDINSIQKFPELKRNSEKYNIQPVYGVDIRTFQPFDCFKYIKNKKLTLGELTYIVVDIETNGLSVECDDLIEIGWCVLQNNRLVEEFDTLIKLQNNHSIKPGITKLTNITNEMLELNGKDIKYVLNKMLSLFDNPNTVFVSHNKFDIKKIKLEFKRCLNIDFDVNYLDTKEIFTIAFPDLKSYSLQSVLNSQQITIESKHRALDDAEATTFAFQTALKKIDNTIPIENIKYEVSFKFQKESECCIIAKNYLGLQQINVLIDKMHREFYFKYPRIPFAEIEKIRNNIYLISGLTRDFEVLEDYFFGLEEIEKTIEKYDFIQFPPLNCIANTFYQKELDLYNFEPEALKKLYAILVEKYSDKLLITSIPTHIFKNENILVKILQSTFSSEKVVGNNFFHTFEQLQKEYNFSIDNLHKNNLKLCSSIDYSYNNSVTYFNMYNFFRSSNSDYTYKNFEKLLFTILHTKYSQTPDSIIIKRVEHELKALQANKSYELYFLTYLVLNDVKNKFNINIGSRGSVGSSFIAFLLGITEVNPLPFHSRCTLCGHTKFKEDFDTSLKFCNLCNGSLIYEGYNIMFEIFVGFDCNKEPDIDLNVPTFLHEQIRDFIITTLKTKYDIDAFRGSMITTLQNKNAFFYINRYVLDKQYGFVEKNTVDLLSYKATGVKLSVSVHPGGILIFPIDTPYTCVTPVQYSKDGILITHIPLLSLHGVVKLDLLAHDDPTTLDFLLLKTGIDQNKINIHDDNIMRLFNNCKNKKGYETALGIPEFGTPFARKLLRLCDPKNVSELISISGLTHGTNVWTDNAEELIFEEGKKLNQIISVRDDVFDNLVKYMDVKDAFSIMEYIRKSQHKKIQNINEWNKMKQLMYNSGVPSWFIISCEKTTYLYPRSHATAYVIQACKIGYFKVYHTVLFYVAYLNRKIDYFNFDFLLLNNDEIKKNINSLSHQQLDNKHKSMLQMFETILEIREQNIKFESIDLYKSLSNEFVIVDETTILAPFCTIKGFGDKGGDCIIRERSRRFTSLQDFTSRTQLNNAKVNTLLKYKIVDLKDITQNDLW